MIASCKLNTLAALRMTAACRPRLEKPIGPIVTDSGSPVGVLITPGCAEPRKQGRTTNSRKVPKDRFCSLSLGCRGPYLLIVAGGVAGTEGDSRLASVGRRSWH